MQKKETHSNPSNGQEKNYHTQKSEIHWLCFETWKMYIWTTLWGGGSKQITRLSLSPTKWVGRGLQWFWGCLVILVSHSVFCLSLAIFSLSLAQLVCFLLLCRCFWWRLCVCVSVSIMVCFCCRFCIPFAALPGCYKPWQTSRLIGVIVIINVNIEKRREIKTDRGLPVRGWLPGHFAKVYRRRKWMGYHLHLCFFAYCVSIFFPLILF